MGGCCKYFHIFLNEVNSNLSFLHLYISSHPLKSSLRSAELLLRSGRRLRCLRFAGCSLNFLRRGERWGGRSAGDTTSAGFPGGAVRLLRVCGNCSRRLSGRWSRRRLRRSNHRQKYDYHDDRRARQGFDHGDDHSIEVAVFQVLCDKICLSGYLHSHGIVSENDEAYQVDPTPKTYPPRIVWRTVLPREMLPMKNGAATHHTIQYAQ